MAGLYIHIPFCKKACHYCDFHFSTSLKTKGELLGALHKEIESRKEEIADETIQSIYFGGGTPSILEREELEEILQIIAYNFKISDQVEITIECNPDDLTYEKLNCIKSAGFNRLSIGIQSFDDEQLKSMNRSHNSTQARECVITAQQLGFDNISIDLIYGLPNLSLKQWSEQIDIALSLNVQHISSYCLTVEKGTALDHFVKIGKVKTLSSSEEALQYEFLVDKLTEAKFIHYEVSNFGLEEHISRHNSSYWKRKKYLGFGPSAHSFTGFERSWNIANNIKYIRGIENNSPAVEKEILSQEDMINELIMTGLRTHWGLNTMEIQSEFGIDLPEINKVLLQEYADSGLLSVDSGIILLTERGLIQADKIASELFLI